MVLVLVIVIASRTREVMYDQRGGLISSTSSREYEYRKAEYEYERGEGRRKATGEKPSLFPYSLLPTPYSLI
jgi:hypothetical protein